MRNDVIERLQITPARRWTTAPKALKGLTFGITRPGAVTQLFPSYLLRKAGLDPEKDATFVQIGGGQALVAAMKAKRIDAFMLSAPAPYLLERDKVGHGHAQELGRRGAAGVRRLRVRVHRRPEVVGRDEP